MLDPYFRVELEHDHLFSLLSPVQCHTNFVEHVVWFETGLPVGQSWRGANDGLLIDDCSIHQKGVIEDAFNFIKTHVNEIVAVHCDLRATDSWTTTRLD